VKLEKEPAVVPVGKKEGEIVIDWFSVPVYGFPWYWKLGGAVVTASVMEAVADPVEFVAVTVKFVSPKRTVGVPEIMPELGLMVNPAGKVGEIVIVAGVPVNVVGIQLLIA
jgi:hypothetical protein